GAQTPNTPHSSWGSASPGSRSWLSRPSPRRTCAIVPHPGGRSRAGEAHRPPGDVDMVQAHPDLLPERQVGRADPGLDGGVGDEDGAPVAVVVDVHDDADELLPHVTLEDERLDRVDGAPLVPAGTAGGRRHGVRELRQRLPYPPGDVLTCDGGPTHLQAVPVDQAPQRGGDV